LRRRDVLQTSSVLWIVALLMLPAYYAEQGICNSRVYVSICLSRRLTAAVAASRFAAECLAGRRYRLIATGLLRASFFRCQRSAANAGSILLRPDGGLTQSCFNMQLERFQSIWDRPISSQTLCWFGLTYALFVVDRQLPIQVDC